MSHTTSNDRFSADRQRGNEVEDIACGLLKDVYGSRLQRNGVEYHQQEKSLLMAAGDKEGANRLQNAPDFYVASDTYFEIKRGKAISKDSYEECLRLQKMGNTVYLFCWRDRWLTYSLQPINNVFLVCRVENLLLDKSEDRLRGADGWLYPNQLPTSLELEAWKNSDGSGKPFQYLDFARTAWKVWSIEEMT